MPHQPNNPDDRTDAGTDDPLYSLSTSQLLAIDQLVSGGTQASAAHAAGVARETVNRWCNHHPEFIAELNRRRQDMCNTRTDFIRSIDRIALEAFADRIRSRDDDAVEKWIQMRGLCRMDTSEIGPTSADQFVDDLARERRSKAIEKIQQRRTEDVLDIDPAFVPGHYEMRDIIEMKLRLETESTPDTPAADRHHEYEEVCWDAAVFAATPDRAAEVDDHGPEGAVEGDVVDVPGLLPADFALLLEVVDGSPPDRAEPPISDPEADWEVHPLGATFTSVIAALTDDQLLPVATGWTETDGFVSELDLDDAVAILTALRDTAAGLPPDHAIYLWVGPELLVEPDPPHDDPSGLTSEPCEESDDL